MKTQIKQLLYGILATSCFGLSCTSLTLGPEEYQWPPKEGQPIVTLLGPVYETRRETQAPLFKALEQAMTAIVENQQTHLPEFYQQRIAGMNHQLFRSGYSNEEEWGSIKSLSSKAEDYDKESMAGILETSENRKHGLEMAIRMQPTIDQNPATVTLEGYRFVLQPSGKGQAEWFTQEVKLTGKKAGEEFQNALIWLLAKPFAQQKSFVLENVKVPVWKDKNTAGTLKFAGKEFFADAEPIRKETAKACVQTRFCPEIKMEGDEFVLVSKFIDAQTICRMFGRELIDKDTLLRLSLIEEGSNLLDKENWSAWHSGGETGYFKEHYGDKEFIQAETGAVWCRLAKLETSSIFAEHPSNYLIGRTGLSLSVYRFLEEDLPNYEKELADYEKELAERIKTQRFYTIDSVTGDIKPTGFTDVRPQHPKPPLSSDEYLRFGKSMVVGQLDQDSEREKITKFWILDNVFARDVEEKTAINISRLPENGTIYIERNTLDYVFSCSRSTCDSFKQSVSVHRLGLLIQMAEFGATFGFGFNKSIFRDLEFGYVELGLEQPLWLIPGFRWSLLGRGDKIKYSKHGNHPPKNTDIYQFIAVGKLSYMLGPVVLFGGAMANTGGSGKITSGGSYPPDDGSFDDLTIKSGIGQLIGVGFRW